MQFSLIDTAGLDSTSVSSSGPETIGSLARQKSEEQIRESQLKILCLDGARPLSDWELLTIRQPDPQRLIVVNKSDLAQQIDLRQLESGWIGISCSTRAGIAELRDTLIERITASHEALSGFVATTGKCLDSLRRCREFLIEAQNAARVDAGQEIVAGDLRMALDHLGIVTGSVHTEDLLGRIFGRFCIGK